MAGETPDYHRFTDDDIAKLIDSQNKIVRNIAVASNNIQWIVKTYNAQCQTIDELKKQIESLKTEISNLKAEVWKYVGVGIGISAAISLFFALLPYIPGSG